MTELIQRVRGKFGMSFLIVEHDIPVIMDIAAYLGTNDDACEAAEIPKADA